MLYTAEASFIIVGGLLSILHGWKYADIWEMGDTRQKPRAWKISQIWRNLIGSAIGWMVAYYYVFHRIHSPQFPEVGDAVPMLIALGGIFGFLPRALFNWSGK